MDNIKIEEPTNFEEAMKKLENTVKELEKGDISLERSMDLFSEGMKLAKICNDKIVDIESRISILVGDKNGELTEEKFEAE